ISLSTKESAWRISTKRVVVIGIGAVLYGLLSYATNFIPVSGNSLRPAIVILTLLAAWYGPLVGFFAGAIGSFLTDLLAGQIYPHWEIGNGIIGLIAGLIYLFSDFDLDRGLVKGKHYILIAVLNIAGNIVGLVLPSLIDWATGTPFLTAVVSWALIPALVNSAWVVTLGLALLAAVSRRRKTGENLQVGAS
ncbi:ECF-type riboflavin transporter substrate-binding protein, partial [Alicyclobacillus shizuokensis]|uniref:ECF-type riboflavin transporter substrate-binding protein n=1 Tax=Alicyclobacillus shizuokensis TaxID=392014 RepID=UPI0008318C99